MRKKILVDTQSFIWFVENDTQLPAAVRTVMESCTMLLSMASLWEITIKMSIGKLKLSSNITELIAATKRNGFILLPIEPQHLIALSDLALLHRDPFDRIIIAQAIAEKIPVITSDDAFQNYPIERIWRNG